MKTALAAPDAVPDMISAATCSLMSKKSFMNEGGVDRETRTLCVNLL